MSQLFSGISLNPGLVSTISIVSVSENASAIDPVRKKVKLTNAEPPEPAASESASSNHPCSSAAAGRLSSCEDAGSKFHCTIADGSGRGLSEIVGSEVDGKGKPSVAESERQQSSSDAHCGGSQTASAAIATASTGGSGSSSSRAHPSHQRRPDTYPAAHRPTQDATSQRRPATMPPNGETGVGGGTVGSLTSPLSLARQLESPRGISILLTFTDDSHKHLERVVRLGDCLRRNGFGVTVDMPRQCFETTSEAETFLRYRFEGSDSVIVCVSPKYRTETESESDEGHAYHSKFLFELISASRSVRPTSSSLASQQQRPQLLCVYLAETNQLHVPIWLHNLRPLYYQWPQNFRDVLFCLSRPQRMFEMQGFPDLQLALSDSCDLE